MTIRAQTGKESQNKPTAPNPQRERNLELKPVWGHHYLLVCFVEQISRIMIVANVLGAIFCIYTTLDRDSPEGCDGMAGIFITSR